MIQGKSSASQASTLRGRVRAAAEDFYALNYNVVPMSADGQKRPAGGSWKKWQTERIPDSQFDKWDHVNYHGYALVTGVAFGGQLPIELFEFETQEIAEKYKAAADDASLGNLLKRVADGYCDRSPGGGLHLLWRCEEVGPNVVLAAEPDDTVLIETRGRGGLAIFAPSGGSVHPSGKPWERLRGGPESIVEITPEERASLLALAQTFDQRPPPEPYRPKGAKATPDRKRPGDDFNAAESPRIDELLEEAGWTFAYTTAVGEREVGYWTRAGKSPAEGISATLGWARDAHGGPALWVFSTSTEFDTSRNPFDKFGVYAVLKHGGDFKAAAAALAADGYGEKKSAGGVESGDGGPTQAQILMGIAERRWELVWWDEGGEPFAIEKGGPNLALPLRGNDSFRAALASAFYDSEGKPPSNEALSQVMLVLEHRARRSDPLPLPLRVAQPESGVIYIDMGDTAGRCVEITAGGWTMLDRSPVTFRRTKATRAFPELEGSDLEALWRFTRFRVEYRPLVKAWLVHAYFPDEDHAILRVTGPQDSGKSQTCKRLVALLDPAIASLRGWGNKTRDIRDWVAHVTASWVSGLENISYIDPELDDALCRSSTGDAVRDRKYYQQSDVDIKMFRRVVLFNDISLGLIKGDLIDRLLEAGIPKLDDKDAIPDERLDAEWEAAYPGIVSGFFNYLVKVLKELPDVEQPKEGWPRPRGFSRILEAVDRVDGTNGMATWREMKETLKADLAHGDLVALCLVELMDHKTAPMEGSATEWLKWLANAWRSMTGRDGNPPSDRLSWPQNERALSLWFKRLVPTVQSVGLLLSRSPEVLSATTDRPQWRRPGPRRGRQQCRSQARRFTQRSLLTLRAARCLGWPLPPHSVEVSVWRWARPLAADGARLAV